MNPIVYHGSPNQFDQFDYGTIRANGTLEGVGFYFTDAKAIAEAYAKDGFLYTAEFTGTKSLSPTEVTIPREPFKRFLSALDKTTDYLSNWGEVDYEGYETVLERAVESEYNTSNDDAELIAGVVNASGNAKETLLLCEEILGYDCIITDADWGGEQRIYIALTHNAYKLIDVKAHVNQPE